MPVAASSPALTLPPPSDPPYSSSSAIKFAVEDYNKKENALPGFSKVVNAKQQVVAGTMYYITLEAKDGDQKKVYEAKVWVKPWMNFQEVQEFKYVGDAPAAGCCSS